MPSPPDLAFESLHEAKSAALRILHDPVPSFTAALDRVVYDREGRPAGVIGTYGWIYSHWLGFPWTDRVAVLRRTLREHAIAHEVISGCEPMLRGRGTVSITLTGLADRLGLGYERTREIAVGEGLLTLAYRRGVAVQVVEEDVARIETDLSERLTVRETCAILGVGKRIVAELAAGQVLSRRADGAFDRRDVKGLAGRLLRSSMVEEGLVAVTALARGGVGPVASLRSAVLAGRLAAGPLHSISKRLDGVGVVAAQARALREDRPLTIALVSRRLRLREDVVRHLAGTGVLSDTADAKPTSGGLAMFERDFVTTVDLARSRAMSPRAVWRALAALGVMPAFGPPDCRQLIYRRKVAERALGAYLAPGSTSVHDRVSLRH